MLKQLLLTFALLVSLSPAVDSSPAVPGNKDNIFWEKVREDQTGGTLNAIVYGNDKFVAVGSEITVSSDGLSWRKADLPDHGELKSIIYENGLFVASGDDGQIITSEDGESWTIQKQVTHRNIKSIVFGNGLFIAAGNGITLTSRNGADWTLSYDDSSSDFSSVAYGSNTFVAAGRAGKLVKSQDGVSWTSISSHTDAALNKVIYGNGVFVAVGNFGTIMTSEDGAGWTRRSSPSLSFINDIIYSNGMFVAAAGTGTVLTSPDGINWTERTASTNGDDLTAVTFANQRFVAVGSSSYKKTYSMQVSCDGTSWTKVPRMTLNKLKGAASNGSTFVAVGDKCTIITSMPEGYKPRDSKQISIKVGSPYMTVDNLVMEIDPGNGTVPLIQNDRMLVPVRAIIEALLGEVAWDANDGRATINLDGKSVILWIGKNEAVVNGIRKELEVAPRVVNSRTMLPLRFIAEELGCEVRWNSIDESAVIIYKTGQDGAGGGTVPGNTQGEEINTYNTIVKLSVANDFIAAKVTIPEGVTKVAITGVDGITFAKPVELKNNEYAFFNKVGLSPGQPGNYGLFHEGEECSLEFRYIVNGAEKTAIVKTMIQLRSFNG